MVAYLLTAPLLLIAALTATASAQAPVELTGRVVEAGSRDGVPSADVRIRPGGLTTQTDAGGGFRVTLPGPVLGGQDQQ